MRHAILVKEEANVAVALIIRAIELFKPVLAPEVLEAERLAAKDVETRDLEGLAEFYGSGIVSEVHRRNAIRQRKEISVQSVTQDQILAAYERLELSNRIRVEQSIPIERFHRISLSPQPVLAPELLDGPFSHSSVAPK